MNALKYLVLEISHDYPEGLKLCDFVKNVLVRGYEHSGRLPLSVEIHEVLKDLCREEIFAREEDEYGSRKYIVQGCLV